MGGLGYEYGKSIGPIPNAGITIEQRYADDRVLLTMIDFQYKSEGIEHTLMSQVDVLYIMSSTEVDYATMPTMNLSDLTDYDALAFLK